MAAGDEVPPHQQVLAERGAAEQQNPGRPPGSNQLGAQQRGEGCTGERCPANSPRNTRKVYPPRETGSGT
jgi:hypothetical protein